MSQEDILKARRVVKDVYMDEKIEKYIIDIVFATRYPHEYKLDKFKGPVATVIVQNGTLKKGDYITAGGACASTRILENFRGEIIEKAIEEMD